MDCFDIRRFLVHQAILGDTKSFESNWDMIIGESKPNKRCRSDKFIIKYLNSITLIDGLFVLLRNLNWLFCARERVKRDVEEGISANS